MDMRNERITEDFVRDHFKQDPLFGAVKFEEQRSLIPRVKKCLSKASKKGTGRPGYPEFIVTIPTLPDDIIVIECKADEVFHESKNRDSPTDYALDGVQHYAKFLSNEFNVIGIAVSGTGKEPRVSSFYQKYGGGGSFLNKITNFLVSIRISQSSMASILQNPLKARKLQN